MIVRHPRLPVEYTIPETAWPAWRAAGWLPLLDEAQRARLAEIEAEVSGQSPSTDSPAAASAADQGQRPSDESEGE